MSFEEMMGKTPKALPNYGTVEITSNGKVVERFTAPEQAAASPYSFVDGVFVDTRKLKERRDDVRANAEQRMAERAAERRVELEWYIDSMRLDAKRDAERHAKHVKQARYALLPAAVVAFPIINTLRYFVGMDDLEWWYA